ncbi:MAG: hypothetical protein JWP81_4600 [Ferruginibacter sp.]|nr:hypothetical protein [Ferruginibacter sp.]
MKYIIPLCAFLTIFFFIPTLPAQEKAISANFDKTLFYTTLASGKTDEINNRLAQLAESNFPEKKAYEGALLMKKAGLLGKPKDKLSIFKMGRSKLESAINSDEANAEYHFLRLVIQENAPKIVKYRQNLQKDSELVSASFKKLPLAVQQAIRNYSKKSAFLNPGDF